MNLDVSPFKALREATGLSAAEFVREAAIARTSGVYLEAGLILMPRAVDKLLELIDNGDARVTLAKQYDVDEYQPVHELLEVATTLWQRSVRRAQTLRITEAYAVWLDDDFVLDVDPFTQFATRAFENRDQFCKAMKVQTGPIKLWLESSRSMPAILETALYDAGLTEKEVGTIEREVREWKSKVFPVV